MKPLSKEASATLSALKASDPTAADEARVRANLEKALGVTLPLAAVTAATAATSAQATAAAGAKTASGLMGLSVGVKAALVVTAVVANTTLVMLAPSPREREGRGVGTRPPPPALSEPVARARPAPSQDLSSTGSDRTEGGEARPAPSPGLSSTGSDRTEGVEAWLAPSPDLSSTGSDRTEGRTGTPRAPTPPPKPSAPPRLEPEPAPAAEEPTLEQQVETNFPTCEADTERRMAASARSLYDQGDAARALELLTTYQRRCPSGRWSDDAWLVRMGSLCELGRDGEVVGLMQWFASEYPRRREDAAKQLAGACSEDVLQRGLR